MYVWQVWQVRYASSLFVFVFPLKITGYFLVLSQRCSWFSSSSYFQTKEMAYHVQYSTISFCDDKHTHSFYCDADAPDSKLVRLCLLSCGGKVTKVTHGLRKQFLTSSSLLLCPTYILSLRFYIYFIMMHNFLRNNT